MKLTTLSPAPGITTSDVYGQSFSLVSLKGSKVLLSFMRFAGCPVCNLRVHELLKQSEAFAKQNIRVVLIYESSKENMLTYLGDEKYPITFLTDPQNLFYRAYGVEKSWFKFFSSFFKGALDKVIKGQKLFIKKPSNDGSISRMGADFLIDENGKINIAHYAEFMGDDLSIQKILNK
ncbi:MAG: alkyl hydroperoxide reductase/Thiol specific antioxidant/Mal allergen [Chitinophagaceae bacterium]|nr:alkyl hydroperoxide reductase/Thiol specific antioxidant/Mal allergen [Chitinophagaceae bacterium]